MCSHRRCAALGALLLAIPLVCCSSRTTSLTKLKFKPPAQNALTLSAEQATLRLPEQSGFNYLYQQSGQQPASPRETRGQTEVTPAGTVNCLAICQDGEEAFAEFQIGADFQTDLAQPTPAVIRWHVEYAHQVASDPPDDAQTEASFWLLLVVRDQAGQVLVELPVNQLSSQDGQTSWSGYEEQSLHVVLQPNTRYYALLAGRIEAKARQGTTARGRVECRKTALDIVLQPET